MGYSFGHNKFQANKKHHSFEENRKATPNLHFEKHDSK